MNTCKQLAVQRLPAEQSFAHELERLKNWDPHQKPPGWMLSPIAVEHFILGDESLEIERKLVASREMITRVIIGIATNRGAMLVGEPGTAKSWFSELLAAAICGQSTLTIQGGSVEQIQQILYRWNEQIISRDGWSAKALVPGPLLRAMQEGKLLRFEELARCPQKLQDAILSVLSERSLIIPELAGEAGILYASPGFNLIATSNSLDAGVEQMSAALKRRLNFETLYPIAHIDDEVEVVVRESRKLLLQSGVELEPDEDIVRVLVTVFHELRTGTTVSGSSTDRLASTAMSTAEAVAVAHALGVHSFYYRDSAMKVGDLMSFLVGAAIKDNQSDLRRLKHYFESSVAGKQGELWQALYQSSQSILA